MENRFINITTKLRIDSEEKQMVQSPDSVTRRGKDNLTEIAWAEIILWQSE